MQKKKKKKIEARLSSATLVLKSVSFERAKPKTIVSLLNFLNLTSLSSVASLLNTIVKTTSKIACVNVP